MTIDVALKTGYVNFQMNNIVWKKEAFMRRVKAATKVAVASVALDILEDAKKKLYKSHANGEPSAPGTPPGYGAGNLYRSMEAIDATTDPDHPKYRVGSNIIYARIQEYGGRISAKKGKFLAVPVGQEGRRAARDCGGNIRSLSLRIVRTKAGKLLLVKDLNKGQKATPFSNRAKGSQTIILFVLKRSVVLPARPYLRPAYAGKIKFLERRMRRVISAAIEEEA